MEAHIAEKGRRFCNNIFVIQEGNVSIHKAKATFDIFYAIKTEIIPWPTRSPGLNPAENAWEYHMNIMYTEVFICR